MSDIPYASFADESSINASYDSSPSLPRSFARAPSFVSPIEAASYAIYVRGLSRSYNKALVLHHLNLTVPTGSIYGLLGPSGCGKTTLLKCLTGRLKAHKGAVLVLERAPGSPGSPVPGRAVGYMPQELALYEEFTIHQNLSFYGRLFGMSAADIAERESFLVSFLHIPSTGRRVKTLSGGQQRRVSLACALLHSPPLLLLDEPTVGVDPVLRARIWQHLRTLSAQGSTIVITTHYIDEARQADYVGFMRQGKILREGRPVDLMAEYRSATLEDVFLLLCNRDERGDGDGDERSVEEEAQADDAAEEKAAAQRNTREAEEKADGADDNGESFASDPTHQQSGDASVLSLQSQSQSLEASLITSPHSLARVDPLEAMQPKAPLSESAATYCPRPSFLLACVWRNMTRFRNNLPALLFVFLLPSIQVILFCIAIGSDPTGLRFGVVNRDAGGNSSEAFVHNLDAQGLSVQQYGDEEDAMRAAKDNDVWGFAVVPANYSANVQSAAHLDPSGCAPSPYSGCIIEYSIDASNEQVAVFVTRALVQAYSDMLDALLPTNLTHSYPLQARAPVYGSEHSSFTDFIAPGMIITIAFSQSIGLTALTLVVDAKSGVMDRGWSAGIRANEMMLSHALTQLAILTVQIGLLLFFGLVVFELPMEGSLALVFTICLALAMAGMLYGLVIAAVCTEERQAMQLALGSFFPALLLSGVIWPLQAIPPQLRWLSLALPTTWAATAGRDVMSRGWGLEHAEVWHGLLIILAWNVALFALAASRMRTQQ